MSLRLRRIWRNGGTVSEADRATIGASKTAPAGEGDDGTVAEGADGAPVAVSKEAAALADEERESFMQRESELLDLLDDKDEEIRQLEREVPPPGCRHYSWFGSCCRCA